MKNHDLYKRFLTTYDMLSDDIDRLVDENYTMKEIVLGDLGCDLAYLRELIGEVYRVEEKKEKSGMDYKKLEENVVKYFDSMSDEELQADFDRHVEKFDKCKKEMEGHGFKCFYLRDGKLGCRNHTDHIKILVKFLRTNEEFMSEQFFDYLTFAVRCMDFAQHWENKFQEMPWIYYGMENLLCARDHIYSFYSNMKYEITDDFKHTLIDAIECVEWFGVNLKDIPRNRQYKDFHEYDKVVLKRNSEYIRHLYLKFLQKDKRAVKREEERLLRKAEENRKPVRSENALLKPVYHEEKTEIEPTALAKSPLPTREEIEELDKIGIHGVMEKHGKEERKYNLIEELKFWFIILVGCGFGGVAGYLFADFVKNFIRGF